MNFADRLALAIEDKVNEGTGRNMVAVADVKALADRLAFNTVAPFTDAGESFLRISFPADESELVISAADS